MTTQIDKNISCDQSGGSQPKPACPLCGAAACDSLRWRPPYSIHACGECRLLFCLPLPTCEQLQEFYQGFLYRRPTASALQGLISQKRTELIRLFGSGDPTGKSFLDYGGGTGVTYQAARKLGYEVDFFEVDEQAIDFVKEAFLLDEANTLRSDDQLDASDKTYDCIMSDNVIEHVIDPVEHVRRLYRHLKPGGTLVIKTPHARNSQLWFHPRISFFTYGRLAKKYGESGAVVKAVAERWWNCDPPRHLYSFSADSMIRAAASAGLPAESCMIRWYRAPLFEYSLTRDLGFMPMRAKAVVKRLVTLPILPLEWLMKLFQVGLQTAGLLSATGVTLVATKPTTA